jgi:hypothetical protein
MFALILLLACQPDADTGGPHLDWSFAFEIAVTEYRAPGSGDAAAWATVTNRESEAPPWELEQSAGDCGFFGVRPQQNCDPVCESGSTCTWDGECAEVTQAIDAGVITVTGLDVALALEPSSEWVYYGYDFEPDPSDGEIFDEGAAITASAAGAALPAFELETLGVAPLGSDLPCPLDASTGGDLIVGWTPGQPGDRVRLSLASANHGNMFPALICDVEDEGELVVSAALLEAWQDSSLPVWSWSLVRSHEGTAVVDGVDVVLAARAAEGCSW